MHEEKRYSGGMFYQQTVYIIPAFSIQMQFKLFSAC